MIDPGDRVDWKQSVMKLQADEVLNDPVSALTKITKKIDPTLQDTQLERVTSYKNDATQSEDFKKRWLALQKLAEDKLTPDERRETIRELAKRLEEFIGWEGSSSEEPGW